MSEKSVYPAQLPLKIFVKNMDNFKIKEAILASMQSSIYSANLINKEFQVSDSKHAKYSCVTVEVKVNSRDELQKIYDLLSSIPSVVHII